MAAAAALLEKCALLSTRHWSGAAAAHVRAHDLRLHAEELIEEDLHAYLDYVAALRRVKGLKGRALAEAVGPAKARTVDVPLDVVRSAQEVAALAAELAAEGNPNLRADAVVAAILAGAAAAAGAILIGVNLGSRVRDPRLAEAKKIAKAASVLRRTLVSKVAAPAVGAKAGVARRGVRR